MPEDAVEIVPEPHVVFDPGVPEFFRENWGKDLTEKEQHSLYRDDGHIARASSGAEIWNRWVHANMQKWLIAEPTGDLITVRFRRDGDPGFPADPIVFSRGAQGGVGESQGCCNFENFIFPTDVVFISAEFRSPASFANALFCGEAKFESSFFRQGLDFSAARFLAASNFSRAQVFGEARFEGGHFDAPVNMDGATFRQRVVFSKAEFLAEAKLTFQSEGAADFKGAVFHGPVDFRSGVFFQGGGFDQAVSFEDVVFKRGVDFSGRNFAASSSFKKARFRGEVKFKKTSFGGNTIFQQASFQGRVDFQVATFGASLEFRNAQFQKDVTFENVPFKGRVDFSGAVFAGDARFSNCKFGEIASFSEVVCFGATSFEGSKFSKHATFQNTWFCGALAFQTANFDDASTMEGAVFLTSANFHSARFGAYADFDYVHFGCVDHGKRPRLYSEWPKRIRSRFDAAVVSKGEFSVPDFRGSDFKLAPNLGFTTVGNPSIPKLPASNFRLLFKNAWQVPAIADAVAAAKFRRLQELAASGHHHYAEKRFFRGELLARIGHEAKTWTEITMIRLFEAICQCGLSFWRPMVWWAVIFVIFSVIYGLSTAHFGQWGYERDFGHLFNYTLANSLPLIGVFKGSDTVAAQALFTEVIGIPFWTGFGAGVHNLLSSIFLFFALLSLRNYFKLG